MHASILNGSTHRLLYLQSGKPFQWEGGLHIPVFLENPVRQVVESRESHTGGRRNGRFSCPTFAIGEGNYQFYP